MGLRKKKRRPFFAPSKKTITPIHLSLLPAWEGGKKEENLTSLFDGQFERKSKKKSTRAARAENRVRNVRGKERRNRRGGVIRVPMRCPGKKERGSQVYLLRSPERERKKFSSSRTNEKDGLVPERQGRVKKKDGSTRS